MTGCTWLFLGEREGGSKWSSLGQFLFEMSFWWCRGGKAAVVGSRSSHR